MTNPGNFQKSSAPFSIRLTPAERQRLAAAAGSQPLGAYVRSRILGKDIEPRRVRRQPVKDGEALARVLGELGRSRLSNNLNQLAKAVNIGVLPVTPETEAEIREACDEVRRMRVELMRALGLSRGMQP